MSRKPYSTWAIGLILAVGIASLIRAVDPARAARSSAPKSTIARGLELSPVPLNMRGKNRNLVGLGSYLVNVKGSCGDCHSVPKYAPGGNPHMGEPKQINTATYLSGGLMFGPQIVSANLTPDENGLPFGHTYPEFLNIMRTGTATHHHEGKLQVMPWPNFKGMTDLDLRAIYEYLRAIPSLPTNTPTPAPLSR